VPITGRCLTIEASARDGAPAATVASEFGLVGLCVITWLAGQVFFALAHTRRRLTCASDFLGEILAPETHAVEPVGPPDRGRNELMREWTSPSRHGRRRQCSVAEGKRGHLRLVDDKWHAGAN
jgi:hypothetical protein